jgi:hypothetical protein
MEYAASTRPRTASELTVLIHVSPTSQGSVRPAPAKNRSNSHHPIPSRTGIRAKLRATSPAPPTIAGTVPKRVAARAAKGSTAITASAGAAPARPTCQPDAPQAVNRTEVSV